MPGMLSDLVVTGNNKLACEFALSILCGEYEGMAGFGLYSVWK